MTTAPLIAIENIPYSAARAGVPSEGIFLRKWQEFAQRAADVAAAAHDEDSNEFLAIFRHANRSWTQPMASAAASFVTWLGTNCGNGFLHECRDRERLTKSDDAFLITWARENRRRTYVNHGLRTVEYLIAEKHPIVNRSGFDWRVDWELVPDVTMEQMDAIECVVEWLASSQGHAFVQACEAEIEAHRKNERLFHHSENNMTKAVGDERCAT